MFSERLRQARRKKGFTQQDLARLTGIHDKQVSKYEASKVEMNPRSDVVLKLATALEVSCDFLIRDDYEEPESKEIKDRELYQLFAHVSEMEEDTKKVVSQVITAFIKAKKVETVMEN